MLEALRYVFDLLPDLAGILLAALSLSVVFLSQELRWFERHNKIRWALALSLAAVGIGGVVSNAIQKSEEKSAKRILEGHISELTDQVSTIQRKLNDAQRAAVGLYAIQFWPNQSLVPEKDIAIQIGYFVTAGLAKNFRVFHETFTLSGLYGVDQRAKAIAKFRTDSAGKLDYQGEDRIPGMGAQGTLRLRLTKKETAQVLADKRTVYVMGRVEWNNAAGGDFHLDVCKWMDPIKTDRLEQRGWHDCT